LALAASVLAAERPDIRVFLQAASRDEKEARAAREELARSWSPDHGDALMLVELARFMRPLRRPLPGGRDDVALAEADNPDGPPPPGLEIPHGPPQDPSGFTRARLIQLLEKQTGQRFGDDLQRWRQWIWSRPPALHPDYLPFKAALYGKVDPRFADFFAPGTKARIRLDEVDWGGVTVNGIPPLDHPRHVPAAEARWLKDDHVVFGVELNGQSRAYPKRVLAWHELARDRLGNVELTLVYCTLCGTVIPYGSQAGGRQFTLGTSGLLYRSNKLMFDEETRSLWSTLEGRPVVGPLADSGLALTAHPVVTTTWREWRAAHPQTTVLSRDTGYERDYAEGAAYRDYFASDDLMFTVPRTDARLKNKDEVLALRLVPPDAPLGTEPRALALSAAFLQRRPVHPVRFAGHDLLVLTSPDGANRVYDTGGTAFVRQRGDGALEDAEGRLWRVGEDALVSADEALRRPRLAAHRAFWFGWYAQFPDTELVR
jgi:uncharacterized protein DUF3179